MKTSKDANTPNTRQTVLLFVVLIVISLLLGSLPALSFGQDASGFGAIPPNPSSSQPSFGGPDLGTPAAIPTVPDTQIPADFTPAPVAPLTAAPATPAPFAPSPTTPAQFSPVNLPVPANLPTTAAVADQRPMLPVQNTGTVANPEPTAKQLQERPDLLRSVGGPDHPFFNYFGPPNDPKSPIQGKPYTVVQLLDGVRNPSARRQLLVAYWELAGLLVESNILLEAERRAYAWYDEANTARNVQRAEGFTGAFYLAQQRRKTTEIAFVRKQYQLVEMLRSVQGARSTALTPENYPIPCDYPIAKNYVTYVDKIARSERARYVGRLIPHQAELIEARKRGRQVTDNNLAAVTRNPQAPHQDWISALNQRTDALVDLVASVVDYNKAIAEYASETVGANVSNYRLLGAVLELPKVNAVSPTGSQPPQVAAPPPRTFSQLDERPFEDQLPGPPMTFAPTESAYSRPLDDPIAAAPPFNPFAEVRSQPVPMTSQSDIQPASLVEEAAPSDAAPNPIQTAGFVEEQ